MTNLPDTKLAAIKWVAGHASLPAGVTVAGQVPDALLSNLPYVAVHRPPSPAAVFYARWDRAALNVQVWAATEQAARDTAAAVYDILHSAHGVTVDGAVLTVDDRDVAGLGEMPDPLVPEVFRQTFTVSATARNT